MEELVPEIQLLINGGVPDDDGLVFAPGKDSGWPHFCALAILKDAALESEMILFENSGIPGDFELPRGAINHPDVHVPRKVVAWFAVTSFLLAVAGNT
jgi:hypothetical protein